MAIAKLAEAIAFLGGVSAIASKLLTTITLGITLRYIS